MVFARWFATIHIVLVALVDAMRVPTPHPRKTSTNNDASISRRDAFHRAFSSAVYTLTAGGIISDNANAADTDRQTYNQRFPTLFDPLYGSSTRRTIKRQLGPNIWALEQNLQLGPLQTPLRCVVIQLDGGGLWVHAPLAPTDEFFDLLESCGDGAVRHVVVPSYVSGMRCWNASLLETYLLHVTL